MFYWQAAQSYIPELSQGTMPLKWPLLYPVGLGQFWESPWGKGMSVPLPSAKLHWQQWVSAHYSVGTDQRRPMIWSGRGHRLSCSPWARYLLEPPSLCPVPPSLQAVFPHPREAHWQLAVTLTARSMSATSAVPALGWGPSHIILIKGKRV